MRFAIWGGLLAGLMATAGCGGGGGGGDLVPVAGTIKVDDVPTGNVSLTFQPEGTTSGNGGIGTTDSTGRYEVTTPQGRRGLPPGQYKVTASLRLNPDGSPADPNTPPIESQARETLPAKYSDLGKTDRSYAVDRFRSCAILRRTLVLRV